MQKTEEDTILMDLFLACIFICHVNYIKIKTNNMAKKYLESSMTKHNITACQYFGLLNKVWAPYMRLLLIGHAIFGGLKKVYV